jgi:prepilin-type N-terminal cleavage/methylation domain-containing protein
MLCKNFPSNRNEGFSLPEILVVVAILGVLAAIAIPISMNQQSRAFDASIKSDLTSAAASLETQLINWRGAPPGDLNICHGSPTYPSPTVAPTNTCDDLEWSAKLLNGTATSPPLTGRISPGVVIQGRVAADGSYCLDGFSTRSGSSKFHYDSVSTQVANGSCQEINWSPRGNLVGSTGATTIPGNLPAPPSGVAVEVPEKGSTATVKWNAQAGVTYIVKISNEPAKTMTAPATGVMSCVFPAETCEGPAIGNLLVGTYTAIVRAGNSEGWGAGATQDFKIENAGGGSLNRVPPPSQPTISQTGADINVSWAAPQDLPDGEEIIKYRISWSKDGLEWIGEIETGTNKREYKLLGASFVSGETYYFRVQAMSDSGILGRSSPNSAPFNYVVTKPAPPGLLYAVPGLNKVDLFWTGSSENTYIVERLPVAGAISNPVCTLGGESNCSATATSLMNGMPYIFTVRTKDPQGVLSDPVEVTGTPTAATPPQSPQNVTLTAGPSGGQATLSWKAPIVDGGAAIIQYKVQWSTTGIENDWNDNNSVVLDERNIDFTPSTSTYTYTVNNLTPGVRYFFRVLAINDRGVGSPSTIVSVIIFAAAPNVTSTAFDTNILISWTRVAGDSGGYQIYRNNTLIGTVAATTTAFRDVNLANGTSYSYAVRAIDSSGNLGAPRTFNAMPLKTATGGTETAILVSNIPHRVHRFPSNATFTVHNIGRNISVEYLIVGGGGGGSGGSPNIFGSGGRGGQVRSGSTSLNNNSSHGIVIGGGGGGGPYGSGSGGTGGTSSAFGISATGGTGPSHTTNGANGVGASGSGRTGIASTITGSTIRVGGGGGGAAHVASASNVDGGGRGGFQSDNRGAVGEPNTGGGGGGSYNNSNPGRNGGSGLVIVRYRLFP